MKKLKTLLMGILCCVGMLSGCGKSDKITIGIVLPAQHDALQAAADGFVEAIEAEHKGEVTVKIYNALGQEDALLTMVNEAADASDLILKLGTGASQLQKKALENKGLDTPLLFSAVTDPVAGNLLENKSAPEGQVTGTSDLNPVADQIALFKEINPSIKKIALFYSSNEDNSLIQIALAEEAAKAIGIETKSFAVSSDNEVASTAAIIFADSSIEGVYVPTDNRLAANMTSIANEAKKNKGKILIGGEGNQVKNGAHITLGVDYAELGKQTGQMAVDILFNGKAIKDIPVAYLSNAPVYINKTMCDACGISIPTSLSSKASSENIY